MTRIIALAGSLKEQSYNKQLVELAAAGAREAGAEVDVVNLADFNIPLFSEDLEAEETPSGVNDLKALFAKSQGILLANPEYNGSITGVLKNALDWLSRPSKDTDIGSAFQGKVAGIMATSPGGLGGLRGLSNTRDILFNLGVLVVPNQIAIAAAHQAFNEAGDLVDQDKQAAVKALGAQIADISTRLN